MNWQSLLKLDYQTSFRLRLDDKNSSWRRLAAILAHSGDSWFWMIGLGLVWLTGSHAWHSRSALYAIGVGGLALLVFGLKFIIRRPRPAGDWGAIYRNTDPHSFPSGHAARAAMLAVLAIGTGPVWYAAVLVLWLPVVSLARVAMGVHYLSDIFAGMIIGILAGLGLLALQPLLVLYLKFLF